MKLEDVHLFKHYPDAEEVRSDVADYYWEVQRFDSDVGKLVAKLKELNEFDNTLIFVTGDHGGNVLVEKLQVVGKGLDGVAMQLVPPDAIEPAQAVFEEDPRFFLPLGVGPRGVQIQTDEWVFESIAVAELTQVLGKVAVVQLHKLDVAVW